MSKSVLAALARATSTPRAKKARTINIGFKMPAGKIFETTVFAQKGDVIQNLEYVRKTNSRNLGLKEAYEIALENAAELESITALPITINRRSIAAAKKALDKAALSLKA